jgi:hypothetical protein
MRDRLHTEQQVFLEAVETFLRAHRQTPGYRDPEPAAGSTPHCRTVALRRMVDALVPVAGGDEALARRLTALQIELAAVEALELRAVFAPDAPHAALLAAVGIRSGELGVAVAELVVTALGYQVLPAPDAHRQHNELPELVGSGAAPGPDAIDALLRYVAGLDGMGARDRLAGLTGSNPHEG